MVSARQLQPSFTLHPGFTSSKLSTPTWCVHRYTMSHMVATPVHELALMLQARDLPLHGGCSLFSSAPPSLHDGRAADTPAHESALMLWAYGLSLHDK